jgi:hypothetical protein
MTVVVRMTGMISGWRGSSTSSCWQLSNRSSTSQGPGQQQQQGLQGVGVMDVEVSGASLTLTGSDLDDDMIPEDISLPIDVSEGV